MLARFAKEKQTRFASMNSTHGATVKTYRYSIVARAGSNPWQHGQLPWVHRSKIFNVILLIKKVYFSLLNIN